MKVYKIKGMNEEEVGHKLDYTINGGRTKQAVCNSRYIDKCADLDRNTRSQSERQRGSNVNGHTEQ